MTIEKKSADEVLREKYEERGWFEIYDWRDKGSRDIEPIPMTEEEYRVFSSLLIRLALKDQNPNLCEQYFELQRRAVYANGYHPLDGVEAEEMEMWTLGTGEVIENTGHGLH